MIVAFMAGGIFGGVSALGCAVLLEAPLFLIIAAYPLGGVLAVLAITVLVLVAPLPRRILLRVSPQA